MKKIMYFVLILPCLLQLGGCVLKKSTPAGLWFYTYSGNSSAKDDNALTPANFLLLQENGTYTSDFDDFRYGVWKSEDHKIYLINDQSATLLLTIDYQAKNEMRVSFGSHPSANFDRQPGSFLKPNQNPFSKENNQWRIKARNKETDTEIKSRLLNHFKFWETYFAWALEDELDNIDVRSTPTLVKIYGNGFALKAFKELPGKWKSYFFDVEDCEKAQKMVKNLFDNNDIAWAHTQNKYKMFISAFQQLQQKLR
jgi:hypothetical protein